MNDLCQIKMHYVLGKQYFNPFFLLGIMWLIKKDNSLLSITFSGVLYRKEVQQKPFETPFNPVSTVNSVNMVNLNAVWITVMFPVLYQLTPRHGRKHKDTIKASSFTVVNWRKGKIILERCVLTQNENNLKYNAALIHTSMLNVEILIWVCYEYSNCTVQLWWLHHRPWETPGEVNIDKTDALPAPTTYW